MATSAPAGPNAGASPELSAFAGGAMIFGAVNSAIGSYFSAKMNKIQLGLQADLANINARVSETAARGEMMKGEREGQAVKMRTGQMKAKQRAAMLANGIALDSGSAQDVLTSTEFMGQIDANTVEANAVRAAWGYRTQAVNYRAQGAMSDAAARGISPTSSAMSSLLGSAAYAAPTYYAMKKSGA